MIQTIKRIVAQVLPPESHVLIVEGQQADLFGLSPNPYLSLYRATIVISGEYLDLYQHGKFLGTLCLPDPQLIPKLSEILQKPLTQL